MEKITYQNKIIAEVHTYLDYEEYMKIFKKTKKGFIKYLTREISATSTGYAGFQTKGALQTSLLSQVFGSNSEINLGNFPSGKLPVKEILPCVERTLKKIYKALPSKGLIRIFLFPTFRLFVKEKMFGVNGFTPWQNTINVYLHPEPKNQKAFLQELNYTVAHEYNHAIRFQYFPPDTFDTIEDSLVNEGLAENFRLAVLEGKISPLASAFKAGEAKKIFKKIKPLLRSRSFRIYQNIFFGNKEFSLWTGYTAGYQIIKSFLQKKPELHWGKIIQIDSKEILQESGWLEQS